MRYCLFTFLLAVLFTVLLIGGQIPLGGWLVAMLACVVLFFALMNANTPPAVPPEPLKPGDVLTVTMECDFGRRKIPFREGDGVKLWVKPDTTMVYAFTLGSVGGDGRVGLANNPRLAALVLGNLPHVAMVVDASMARDGFVELRVVVEPVDAES